MLRFTKRLHATACVALAVLLALVAAPAAHGATYSASAQTTSLSIRNLTTTDSALGNTISDMTVAINVLPSAPTGIPVDLGSTTGGTSTVRSPTGVGHLLITPWLIRVTGTSGSGIAVQISRVGFEVSGTPAGTVRYSAGVITGTIGPSPASSLTVTGSSIPSSIGTTASYARGSTFTFSPALTYAFTP